MKERCVPIFPVRDLDRARAFYERLGFVVTFQSKNDYAILVRDRLMMHLARASLDVAFQSGAAFVNVADAAAYYDDWTARGLDAAPPTARPWGGREFHVRDPDGNLLRVSDSMYGTER